MEQFNSPSAPRLSGRVCREKSATAPGGLGDWLRLGPLADSRPHDRRRSPPGCLRASPPLSVGGRWLDSPPAAGPVGSLPFDPKPHVADDQYEREEDRLPQPHAKPCPPSLPPPIVASVRGLRPRLRRYGPRPAKLEIRWISLSLRPPRRSCQLEKLPWLRASRDARAAAFPAAGTPRLTGEGHLDAPARHKLVSAAVLPK